LAGCVGICYGLAEWLARSEAVCYFPRPIGFSVGNDGTEVCTVGLVIKR